MIFESATDLVGVVWVCSKLKVLLLLLLLSEEELLSMSASEAELMILLSLSCCLSCSSCICSLVFLGFRFFLTVGFVWILRCLVNSSDREKRFGHRSKVQRWGFSPVCVRMCRVWCSSLWKAFLQRGHLYGRSFSLFDEMSAWAAGAVAGAGAGAGDAILLRGEGVSRAEAGRAAGRIGEEENTLAAEGKKKRNGS